ncbi:MAG: hypothetical protein KDA93_14950 [Planctomycetaceae bacterium]|nr:hypothetical protein [Planctomycetaceae bacterium]
MPLELHVLNHPDRCRCLLSKGLYINAGLEPGKEATGDGNYWCAKTQTIYGPDRQICDREECLNHDRTCYEAPF